MFIQRDYKRTENDDFQLNVQHHLNERNEAVPQLLDSGDVVGWKIQSRYE